MKKTLIALALTALPVAAMADVTLYGQIKGGVEVSKFKGVSGTITQVVDYGSRIGFKGHEYLNGNLKAIWQLEQRVNISGDATGFGTRDASFGTRDSFIGLAGDFGTVKAGHQETPVAELNGKLDQWEYSNAAAGLSHFTRDTDATGRRLAVSYETPNVAGFSAKAYVSASDNNEGTGRSSTRDSAVYGLSASYENSGFFADAAGVYVKNARNNATTGRAYQALVQGGYDNGKVLAAVAFQQAKNVEEDVATGREVAVSGAYRLDDALRLKASAAHVKATINDTKAKYYQGIVGADYALSKRTELNGQVGVVKLKTGEVSRRVGTFGVGLKHAF